MFVTQKIEHMIEHYGGIMLNERQNRILEITEKRKRVSVEFLAKTLYVSEMTVRRDLQKMDREGLIKRYHGGALACEDYIDYSFDLRMRMNEKEKKKLAAEAQKHIRDGPPPYFRLCR